MNDDLTPHSCSRPETCTVVRADREQLHMLTVSLGVLRGINAQLREVAIDQAARVRELHALNWDALLLYIAMSLTCIAYALVWPVPLRIWPNYIAAALVIIRVALRRARRGKEKK